MKRNPKIKEIYSRFLKNEATAAEIDKLFTYFETEKETQLRELITISDTSDTANNTADTQRQLHLYKLQVKINAKIDSTERPASLPRTKKSSIYNYFNTPVYKIAASLLLIAFLSFFIFKYLKSSVTNEIKPGGNYATLFTADGQQLNLKNSANTEIAEIQGITIRKTGDGHITYIASSVQSKGESLWNSIVTPLGGKYRVTLSDGSTVVLNSGSKLEFPIGFHGQERRVKLTGEAYFEITKDPSKPFIVISGEGRTEVLGTKFNISSYPEDGLIKTTLLEGKVKFSGSSTQNTEVLKPGEQAILKDSHIQISPVNAEDFMAWKDNKFVFKNEELAAIMHRLSRWYNVEVDYNSLPERRIYASISTNVNLSEVLRMLEITSDLKFNVDERRISVMK
jgi:transmembrane sensor